MPVIPMYLTFNLYLNRDGSNSNSSSNNNSNSSSNSSNNSKRNRNRNLRHYKREEEEVIEGAATTTTTTTTMVLQNLSRINSHCGESYQVYLAFNIITVLYITSSFVRNWEYGMYVTLLCLHQSPVHDTITEDTTTSVPFHSVLVVGVELSGVEFGATTTSHHHRTKSAMPRHVTILLP